MRLSRTAERWYNPSFAPLQEANYPIAWCWQRFFHLHAICWCGKALELKILGRSQRVFQATGNKRLLGCFKIGMHWQGQHMIA
jgi:hypothetical protein